MTTTNLGEAYARPVTRNGVTDPIATQNSFTRAGDTFASKEESSPYSVLIFSDVHFPLKQSAAEELYEMLLHVYESGGVGAIVRNGDWFDGWEAKGKNLSDLQKCVIDLMNRMHEEFGTIIIDTEGNHNDRQIEEDVAQKGANIGLHIVPGLKIETPHEDTVVFHGNQFDSKVTQTDILEQADNEYRRLSKNGEKRNTDTASYTKRLTKILLSALGYDRAYSYAAHKYGADRIIIGHRHLPEDRVIKPYNATKTFSDSLQRKFLFSSGERLSNIWEQFTKDSGNELSNSARRLTLQFVAANGKWMASALDNPYLLKKPANFLANALKSKGHDGLSQFMRVIDAKPDTSLLDHIDIKRLRPSYYFDQTEEQKTTPRKIKFTDAGSWIDGNTTYCMYDKGGNFSLKDWKEERLKHGYEAPSNAEKLIAEHNSRFGGLTQATVDEAKYYEHEVAGYLDREKRQEFYQLPNPEDIGTLRMDDKGRVCFIPPLSKIEIAADNDNQQDIDIPINGHIPAKEELYPHNGY